MRLSLPRLFAITALATTTALLSACSRGGDDEAQDLANQAAGDLDELVALAADLGAGAEAMRLGGAIYVVPFFFVLNPALIGQGSTVEVLTVLATALVGIWLFGSSLQGYVAFLGETGGGTAGWVARGLLLVGGAVSAGILLRDVGGFRRRRVAFVAGLALGILGTRFL